MHLLLIVLLSNGYAVTDSLCPGEMTTYFDGSIIETFTMSYSFEYELNKHPHFSLLFSGGPFLFSDTFFDSTMWGCGLDAELRRRKSESSFGYFVSGISGFNLKWSNNGDLIESFHTGVKFGWNYNLKDTGFQLDLEPSIGGGVQVENVGDTYWEFDPEPYFIFELGLMIH